MSALDVSVRAQVLNLHRRPGRRASLTLVFVSHDLSVVRHVCDRVAVMHEGRIVEIGPVEQVYEDPQHPYTRRLVAAVPTLRKALSGVTAADLAPPRSTPRDRSPRAPRTRSLTCPASAWPRQPPRGRVAHGHHRGAAPAGGAVAGVDVRGGGPGTRETDLLDPRERGGPGARGDAHRWERVRARRRRRGAAVALRGGHRLQVGGPGEVVPIVPGAVIFDLGRGGDFVTAPTRVRGRGV